jgi:hypothetical protein
MSFKLSSSFSIEEIDVLIFVIVAGYWLSTKSLSKSDSTPILFHSYESVTVAAPVTIIPMKSPTNMLVSLAKGKPSAVTLGEAVTITPLCPTSVMIVSVIRPTFKPSAVTVAAPSIIIPDADTGEL